MNNVKNISKFDDVIKRLDDTLKKFKKAFSQIPSDKVDLQLINYEIDNIKQNAKCHNLMSMCNRIGFINGYINCLLSTDIINTALFSSLFDIISTVNTYSFELKAVFEEDYINAGN